MFIHEYVNEVKLNCVCSQNNMKDCADAVKRNRIDGCRFLVGSFLGQMFSFGQYCYFADDIFS